MIRALGLAVMVGGLWFFWSRKVEAAPMAEEMAVGSSDIAGLVRTLNQVEFGGWFDPADVLAVIEIESNFDARAYRAEPRLNDASRGLMQVLLSTARDRGFDGPPEGLFDPETNIRAGMAQLRWIWDYLADRLGEVPSDAQWIGAYNAGVGNVMKGYLPLSYVTRWSRARARLRGVA